MKRPAPKNYTYSWGGSGFSILFQSLLFESLEQLDLWDAFCIRTEGNKMLVYWSKNALEQAAQFGSKLFVDLESASKHCEKIKQAGDKLLDISTETEITSEYLKSFFRDAKQFIYNYMLLDPEFSDQAILNASEELTEYLGRQKNTYREYLNKIFFTNTATLSKIVNRLCEQEGLQAEDIHTHTYTELQETLGEGTLEYSRNFFLIWSCNGSTEYNFDPDSVQDVWETFTSDTQERLSGTAVCGTGTLRGEVLIIDIDYSKDISVQIARFNSKANGYILVADHTTPELVPLMKRSKAIVTDQGGMLSHAAIVSRELNIPCIVGAGNATSALQNGDEVVVDFDAGEVRKQ